MPEQQVVSQIGEKRVRGNRGPLVILVLCLALLIGIPTVWLFTRSDRAAAVPQSFASDDPATDESDSAPQEPPPPYTPGTIAPATVSIARPAIFQVPSLGISTEIRSIGVSDDGQVAIPKNGNLVGWYRFGSAPGATRGSAVIVGHRDTKAAGPGVLYPLSRMKVGEVISIYRDDWIKVTYRVVSAESYNKSVVPLDDLFSRAGAPRLTVITCGGEYVKGRGYQDNFVVTAVPTSAPS